jgi:hypothetical protein
MLLRAWHWTESLDLGQGGFVGYTGPLRLERVPLAPNSSPARHRPGSLRPHLHRPSSHRRPRQYHPSHLRTAVVTAAIVGSIVNSPPSGCVTQVINGLAYQQWQQHLVPAAILRNHDDLHSSQCAKMTTPDLELHYSRTTGWIIGNGYFTGQSFRPVSATLAINHLRCGTIGHGCSGYRRNHSELSAGRGPSPAAYVYPKYEGDPASIRFLPTYVVAMIQSRKTFPGYLSRE